MRIFLALCLALLCVACSLKKANLHSNAVFVSIVSPQLRLSEAGFLYEGKNEVRLELYKLAQPLFLLRLSDDKICLNGVCYTKKDFHQKYLNSHYEDFLEDILRFKPLYEGKNLMKTECGFSQNFENGTYSLCDGLLEFKDEKLFIRIKK